MLVVSALTVGAAPVLNEAMAPAVVPPMLLAARRTKYVVDGCSPDRSWMMRTAFDPLPIGCCAVLTDPASEALVPYSNHASVALPLGVTRPATVYTSPVSSPMVVTPGGGGVLKLRMAPRTMPPALLATVRK